MECSLGSFRVWAFFLISTIFLTASFAHAQQSDTGADLANCFDYYHFGSVQVDVTPSMYSTVSGVPLEFSGVIKNSNPYPVVDGRLYVKVFRYGKSDSNNGPDVVDQYVVKDGIAIAAGSSTAVSFSWTVPSYAQSGDYGVAAFFVTDKKFNLLGLSFTDDVTGNTVRFKVVGEQEDSVGFVKQGVTVNGEEYHFAKFPPNESATDPIVVRAQILNGSSKEENVRVHWQLYSWDAQTPENLLAESDEQVRIAAGKIGFAEYTARNTAEPVYLLVGTIRWGDSTSIINVRFVREGIDRLRLNFPSISSFPLKKGEANVVFTCFSNTADGTVSDGRVELSVLDKAGKTIHSTSYNGKVTGAMMSIADAFTPPRAYDSFTVRAKLYQGDRLVDVANTTYDCKTIDPKTCSPSYLWQIILGVLILLSLSYIAVRLRKHETIVVAKK